MGELDVDIKTGIDKQSEQEHFRQCIIDQLTKNKMGSEQSKPRQKLVEDEYFVVESLEKMGVDAMDFKKYIWIDPKMYNSQNQRYLALMRELVTIQSCTSVEGASGFFDEAGIGEQYQLICAASLPDEQYGVLQNQPKVQKMILFCQKEERAKLLQSNFSKIESFQFNFDDLIQAVKDNNKLKSQTRKGINALFMNEEDTHLLNKYRLNYACLCKNHSQQRAKADFAGLARKIMPDQEQNIKEFEKNYKINLPQQQAIAQTLSWATRKSFFWDLIQQLPSLTTDPKRLAYLRLPFRDLYKAVKTTYERMEKIPKQLYIVKQLTEQELGKLKKNIDNFVIFTSFTKGYTSKKDANKARKANKNNVMFQVILSKDVKDQELDFGFAVTGEEGQNVIINIYNFFLIKNTENLQSQVAEITYGALAVASAKRVDKKQLRKRPTQFQQDLLRNYDYLEDLMKKVNSQATVLQMSGYFKESIQIYEKKSDFLGKSRASQEVMDRYYLQVGDAYKMGEQYKRALQEYGKIATEIMKLVAQVHIAELYHQNKEKAQFQATMAKLQPRIPQIQKHDPPEAFKAMNYVAISLMNQQKYKEANKKFNEIIPEMTKYYNYKYEGIPLVHDMFRNKATCESKMKNYSEALNLLRSTKGWQKVCEGITPNYALTETLIQQVHLSKGDQLKANELKTSIEDIKKTFLSTEEDYISKSRVVINLNESLVNIDF